MEINKVTLEDNLEYNIIATIKIGDVKYLYLSGCGDTNNTCIRKLNKNETEILGLENEMEYQKALIAFNKTYKDLFC